MDRERRSNSRLASLDPENEVLKRGNYARRARSEGNSVYLEGLRSLKSWNEMPGQFQNFAAEEVMRRLGSGWSFRGMARFGAQNIRQHVSPGSIILPACQRKDSGSMACGEPGCRNGMIHKTITTNIAVFVHADTRLNFHLIPGQQVKDVMVVNGEVDDSSVSPFLVTFGPVSEECFYSAPRLDADGNDISILPVTNINYIDADKWCSRNSFRLPTPKEWHWAALGGAESTYYWGNHFDGLGFSHVWYGQRRPVQPSKHAEQRAWNSFGLVDVFGNVQEMCDQQLKPGSKNKKAFVAGASFMWSSDRFRRLFETQKDFGVLIDISIRTPDLGFRAVKDIPSL